MPGAIAMSLAGCWSPPLRSWTKTSLAYITTWAFVRILPPAMTAPEPEIFFGLDFVHGWRKSGSRCVTLILTTASATSDARAADVAVREQATQEAITTRYRTARIMNVES